MTIKLSEILNFQNFYSKIKDKKLSIKTAYKFTKIFHVMDEEIKFYQTKLKEICETYGEKNEDNSFIFTEDGGIKIKEDKVTECQREIQALSNFTVEIPDFVFTIEELGDLELSVDDLYPVLKFIAE